MSLSLWLPAPELATGGLEKRGMSHLSFSHCLFGAEQRPESCLGLEKVELSPKAEPPFRSLPLVFRALLLPRSAEPGMGVLQHCYYPVVAQ